MDLLFGIALSLALGILPMATYAAVFTFFDPYEKEPVWLMVGVFLWGAVVAAGAALIINTLFGVSLYAVSGSEGLASVGTAVIAAPVVEESVKGLAVLAVFLYFRHEFDSLLDGVLYGGLVGFGFAATENVNYIFTGFAEGGLAGALALTALRAVGIAFLHATLTACTGLGFALFRLNIGLVRWLAPPLGYGAAIVFHAAHNLLASLGPAACLLALVFDWIGFAGLFAFILFLIWYEGRVMRDHLQEEVQSGLITAQQFRAAQSLTGQFMARWNAFFGGSGLSAGRFYDLLGELAFKKYQLARRGPEFEPEAPETIARLRGQIGNLRQRL